MNRLFQIFLSGLLFFCCAPLAAAAEPQEKDAAPASLARAAQPTLTQGSLSAITMPTVTVYGVADRPPVVPDRKSTRLNSSH